MNTLHSVKNKLNRPETVVFSRCQRGSFRKEGKKEGVWGRNFCLPFLLYFFLFSFPAPPAPFRAAHFFLQTFLRRAVAGRTARLHQCFAKFSWRLASMILFEISSNFVIQAAPNGILRKFCGFLVWNLQAASHLLPREPEVRADFLQKLSFLF